MAKLMGVERVPIERHDYGEIYMEEKTPRPFWQYGLRTLLWLMLCIAIGFGAYRQGYERGTTDQNNLRNTVGATFARVYDVHKAAPLTKTAAEFELLVSDVRTKVLPHTWDLNGGEAQIQPFPTNLSFVVNHDKDGHERVAAYLDQLRTKIEKQRLASRAR